MFAVIDIESSGGNLKTSRITEIAIIIHNGKRVIEEFCTLVNPETPIDPFVVALTGISNSMVDDAPTFNEIADRINLMTKNRIIVAHNSRFDYGILKNEFKRLGKRFQRKNLCTVKMSRKLLPGHSSYSLGKLCDDLNIPIKNRHRAMGDAAATTVLLEKMLFTEKKSLLKDLLKDELDTANLPKHVSPEEVNNLPEEIGVYYFLNEKQQAIYIGKSKNIRKRILSHFSSDVQSKRFSELKEKTYTFDYQITGSELVAELLEAGEIKRFMPDFNRAQRRKKYRYGIFSKIDDDGFHRLFIELLHPEEKALLKFTSKKWAEKSLSDLILQHKLSQEKRLHLGCKSYNKIVEKAIRQFHFEEPNLLIIDEGRTFFEKSIVLIQYGHYFGYKFIDEDELESQDMTDIIQSVPKDYNSPDKEKIIHRHLQKNKQLKTIILNEKVVSQSTYHFS